MSALARLRLPPHTTIADPDAKRAAVAAIFGPNDELLFIHRAVREGDLWSGHMAFPGGRAEPDDASLLHTARRETREELGLDLSEARCLGALSPLASPRNAPKRHISVVPYVFTVPEWAPLTPNEEVAGVVRLAFDRFLAREARGTFPYTWQGVEYELPCVRLDGTLLWGMTLRMVDELIEQVERS
ncbi:coenzyme A pyrophosphatase [Deltaproteobacteria bacterium]|nr:coenzyme A pyrophosphatase [Deltaproteobacteria bacterium]